MKEQDRETVEVGRIVGAFGLRGQVKVETFTEFPERFDVGKELCVNGEWRRIVGSTIHKGRPLLKFEGVNDATAAEALQWAILEADAEDEVEMEEDEYFAEDLVGLRVVTEEGREVGEVEAVLAYPAQDLLQVGSLLIPLVRQFVKSVDLEEEVVTVALIPGMLPD